MKTQISYIVSFGDSDRYRMEYSGNKEEFERSEGVKNLVDAVYGYVMEKFPGADIADVIPLRVKYAREEDRDYPALDGAAVEALKKDAVRQVEVKQADSKLDNDAPYSSTD